MNKAGETDVQTDLDWNAEGRNQVRDGRRTCLQAGSVGKVYLVKLHSGMKSMIFVEENMNERLKNLFFHCPKLFVR